MDEAGRAAQPPLVMASPSLKADPDGEATDTVDDNSIMSRKVTGSSRPGVAQRANGSNGSSGDSATLTSNETIEVEASTTADGWQRGRQSMTSGESKDPEAASPPPAQDDASATRSDLKPVSETTYSGTGYSRPSSYTRSEWSQGPDSRPTPAGTSASSTTSASRASAASAWAGAAVPGQAPAAAGDNVGSSSHNGYTSRAGFSSGAASAVSGAAAGLANSMGSAWQKRGSTRGASPRKPSKRQAMLTLARVEPWSVMKFSFVASVVAFIVLFVAVAVLYMVLSALGVFDSLQNTVSSVTSSQSTSGTNISHWFSASLILGYTAMLGALNIVLITAMSTVGAVIYNLIAKTIGGIEVTLRETD